MVLLHVNTMNGFLLLKRKAFVPYGQTYIHNIQEYIHTCVNINNSHNYS